jgi:hypothetical protein
MVEIESATSTPCDNVWRLSQQSLLACDNRLRLTLGWRDIQKGGGGGEGAERGGGDEVIAC